jgi:hypothetical protein
MDPTNPVATQEGWGDAPGITAQNKNVLALKHRAKFRNLCCDSCNGELPRKYFYIWENSIEFNDPNSCSLDCPIGIPYMTSDSFTGGFTICAIPPNYCCPGTDYIRKVYMDRGIFDHQSCCWHYGCMSGIGEMHPNEIRHVCCFQPCPDFFDSCVSCYWPDLCGERVRWLPAKTCCCCISTEAGSCTNCCGLCGVETGQPDECWLKPVATHLEIGEAQILCDSFNAAYEEYKMYTGVA